MNLYDQVVKHFNSKGRRWPSPHDALLFLFTEIAEATELYLSQPIKAYVRSHPEQKEPYSEERYAEELGDVIYMAIVAGAVMGVDPVEAMVERMSLELGEESEPNDPLN